MTNGSIMPRAWRQEYSRQYHQRPDVKAKQAARIRDQLTDPQEGPKIIARRLTRNAIRRGDLVRLPCEVCGAEKVDSHHDDYTKPLDVRWLCRTHHNEVHGRLPGPEFGVKYTGPGHAGARKTHCLRGHPLSGDNVRVRGQRHCRACDRIRTAKCKANKQKAKVSP